nr:MAG TPA: hypothetical protein [Crassvirales sp.]
MIITPTTIYIHVNVQSDTKADKGDYNIKHPLRGN